MRRILQSQISSNTALIAFVYSPKMTFIKVLIVYLELRNARKSSVIVHSSKSRDICILTVSRTSRGRGGGESLNQKIAELFYL